MAWRARSVDGVAQVRKVYRPLQFHARLLRFNLSSKKGETVGHHVLRRGKQANALFIHSLSVSNASQHAGGVNQHPSRDALALPLAPA